MTNDDSATGSALRAGTRVGSYTVVKAFSDRLELRGHRGGAVMLVLLGLLIAGWGSLAWMALLSGSKEVPERALFLPLVGVVIIMGGVAQLFSALVVDGASRTLYRLSVRGKGEALGSPYMVTVGVTPTNIKRRETVAVRIEAAAGGTVVLGARRTDERDALNLLAAAAEATRLLGAQLAVTGSPEEGGPPMRDAMASLRGDRAMSPRRPAAAA